MNIEQIDYEVLRFNIEQHLDPSIIDFANIEVSSYLDFATRNMAVNMTTKILALPEERIVIDEVVYDSWWHHFLDSFKLLKFWFGEPKKRKISIDKQIYGHIITNEAIPDGRTHVSKLRLEGDND